MKLISLLWTGIALIALVTCARASIEAQEISVTPYIGLGPETKTIGHSFFEFSMATGLRLEALDVWGGYARAALRGVTNICEDSLPPTCRYPEGTAQEYAGGLTYALFSGERWQGRGGVGGGVLFWQGAWDPFIEFTADFRKKVTDRLSIVLGINVVAAPGVERERSGLQAIVSEKDVYFPNAVVGLAIRPD